MQKMFRPIFSVAFVLVFLGLFFYLGFQGGTSKESQGSVLARKPVKIDVNESTVKAQILGLTEDDSLAMETPQQELGNTDIKFQQQLKNCLNLETELSLTDFIETQMERSALKREVLIENYHFALSNGTERRIQTLPAAGDLAKGPRRIRVFSLDAENLPVPEKISADIQKLPYSRQIHALSEGREPFFAQAREVAELKGGQKMELEWTQQKVSEFQWSGAGFLFSCRESDCHCSH